jgi:hypothetical protein
LISVRISWTTVWVVGALLLAALGDALQKPRLGVLRDGNAGFLAGAVVVDIALLLQLGGQVAAAGAAEENPLYAKSYLR